MELNSVYVGIKDMNRALDFYQTLFEVEPTQEEERFSTSEFKTVNFSLYGSGYSGFEFELGNNCVPNLEVDDVDSTYHRIKKSRRKWFTTRFSGSGSAEPFISSMRRETRSRYSVLIRIRPHSFL